MANVVTGIAGIATGTVTTVATVGAAGARVLYDTLAGANVADTQLAQTEYDFRSLVFPSDLNNEYHGKYVVININVPVTSGGEARSNFKGAIYRSSILNNEFSKVDVLRFGSGITTPGLSKAQFELKRYTRRIKESIALAMPQGLVHEHQNVFEELSLTALGGKLAVATATAAGGLISSKLGNALGNVLNATGQAVGKIAGIAGYPINPRVQVIFSTTRLRQYRFDFLMAPRNQKEAQNIEEIVKTIRFHSVPELDPKTNGWTFIPPAEFDVTFFDRGKENTHMIRVNTCVCNAVMVDYNPTGVYSQFHDGHPVAVRLSLALSEVEPLHKTRVLQGF